MFEVAIFTDVTAAESVTGFDGFQFQSVSPGFDGEDMAVVQGELNFVPLSTWGSAHGGDDRSHPEQYSFAIRNDRFYLTKSKALGLTANGRPGNQLTEVAATSSADDLVPYTPAQLLTATAWTGAKAPAKTRESWLTPLQISPGFETEELESFVRSDPWVLGVLPAFVTMLRRSLAEEGHRVFIHHTELTVVLRWIALGALLLDSDSAARLTFRVFHANPWNGPFKVVGVHPELLALAPAAEWQNSPSASWIDPEARTIGETVPSVLAESSVRWLADHGVYEAMGATQLAAELEPTLGPDLAVQLADLVTFDSAATSGRTGWDVATKALTALAAAGQRETIESVADELLDALVAYRPEREAEFTRAADTVAALLGAGLTDVACEVLEPTLEALAGSPEFAGSFARPIANAGGALVWSDEETRRAASQAWATALAAAKDSELSALFGATNHLALELDRGLLLPAVGRLAEQWAADPSLGAESRSWYASELIQDVVAEKVAAALERGDERQTRALLSGEWSALMADAHSPLSGWLRVRELVGLAPDERVAGIRASAPGSIPPASWRIVLGMLGLPLDSGLISAFIRTAGLPDDLALELAQLVRQENSAPELTFAAGAPPRWRELFDLFIETQHQGAELVSPLPALVLSVEQARHAFADARQERGTPVNPALRDSASHARVWAMEDLVDTGELLVTAQDSRGAMTLADNLGGMTHQALDAFLEAAAGRREGLVGGRAALHAYANSAGALRDELGFAVNRLLDRHRDIQRSMKKDESLAPLLEEVAQRYPVEAGKSWRNPGSWFGQGEK